MTKNSDLTEKLLTIKEAADRLGVPRWKLYRAVKRGDFPHHTLFNSRKLVYLSEIDSAIRRANGGDPQDPPAAECSLEETVPRSERRSGDSSTDQKRRPEGSSDA
jgi:excisionase family DNA binding protein